MHPLGLFLRTSIPFINKKKAYYECLPTRLDPLAERTCLSQASTTPRAGRTARIARGGSVILKVLIFN